MLNLQIPAACSLQNSSLGTLGRTYVHLLCIMQQYYKVLKYQNIAAGVHS